MPDKQAFVEAAKNRSEGATVSWGALACLCEGVGWFQAFFGIAHSLIALVMRWNG